MNAEELQKQFPGAIEYLTDIFLIARDYGKVSNARLADWMGVSRSAVTQAVSRLKKLGLASQRPYESIELTAEGRRLAVVFLRRHYLIEHVLVRVLGYPWDKADEEAKVLQGTISDDLAEHLYKQLGQPKTCPHGNPFPDDPRATTVLAAPPISEADPDRTLRIVRITEEGEAIPDMLHFCYEHKLEPGSRVQVVGPAEDGLTVRAVGKTAADVPSEFVVPGLMVPHLRFAYLEPEAAAV